MRNVRITIEDITRREQLVIDKHTNEIFSGSIITSTFPMTIEGEIKSLGFVKNEYELKAVFELRVAKILGQSDFDLNVKLEGEN